MKRLVPMYKKVGQKRYRETYGLYYEELEIGDVFEHRPGRTITETDNIWACLLTMNSQQLHFDAAYAAHTEWKKCPAGSSIPVWRSPWTPRRACPRQTRDGCT